MYQELTKAQCPKHRRHRESLRAKVAEVVAWTLYWGLFFYTMYRWAES